MKITLPQKPTHLSVSQLNTYTSCRMKWYWSYYRQLKPVKISNVLSRGILGHAGLAALDLGEYPQKAVLKCVQERFAPCSEEERMAMSLLVDEVVGQIRGYADYWPGWDDCIAVEREFRVKLPRLPIPVLGYWDNIVKWDGAWWVLERKWVNGQFRTEAMFELDRQFALYELAAKAHGLTDIKGTIVDQINLPAKPPKLNKPDKKTGAVSMSRQPVGDKRSYTAALIENGLNLEDYQEVLENLPDTKEFRRNTVFRSSNEIAHWSRELAVVGRAASAKHQTIFMVDDRIRCQTCQFRELCMELVQTGSAEDMADSMFQKKGEHSPIDVMYEEEPAFSILE